MSDAGSSEQGSAGVSQRVVAPQDDDEQEQAALQAAIKFDRFHKKSQFTSLHELEESAAAAEGLNRASRARLLASSRAGSFDRPTLDLSTLDLAYGV
jgi:hypothetical protein